MDLLELAFFKAKFGGADVAPPVLERLEATENGVYSPGQGVDGFDRVEVAVPGPALQQKTATENGVVVPDSGYDGLSRVTVNVRPVESLPEKAVNLRDYNGAVLHAYTAEEFAALSALPDNPSREGLIAQGWNWALANAQAYVAKNGALEIGQMYITDDGKTRVYIRLEEGYTSPMMGLCPNGVVDIDWGDGTAHDTLTGGSTTNVKWTPAHNYEKPGEYVIRISAESGNFAFYGTSAADQHSGLLRHASASSGRNAVYQNAIQRIEIGGGINIISSNALSNCRALKSVAVPRNVIFISDGAFRDCLALSYLAIPDDVTTVGNYAFQNCAILARLSIPRKAASVGNYVFYGCGSLSRVAISDGATRINMGLFTNCHCLARLVVPESIGNIGDNVFIGCSGLAQLQFKGATPPAASASSFSGIPTDCVIIVPSGTLAAYTGAANYPSSATYTYVEDSDLTGTA